MDAMVGGRERTGIDSANSQSLKLPKESAPRVNILLGALIISFLALQVVLRKAHLESVILLVKNQFEALGLILCLQPYEV